MVGSYRLFNWTWNCPIIRTVPFHVRSVFLHKLCAFHGFLLPGNGNHITTIGGEEILFLRNVLTAATVLCIVLETRSQEILTPLHNIDYPSLPDKYRHTNKKLCGITWYFINTLPRIQSVMCSFCIPTIFVFHVNHQTWQYTCWLDYYLLYAFNTMFVNKLATVVKQFAFSETLGNYVYLTYDLK